MRIILDDINYKGHHFDRVSFKTDDKGLTEKEIIEKIKCFLNSVISKVEKKENEDQ